MAAPIPRRDLLWSLSPSLRRSVLKACAKLVASDIEYWNAAVIVWQAKVDGLEGELGWLASCELQDAKNERRNAYARRRRFWTLADEFGVMIGQQHKSVRSASSDVSPELTELLRSARDRYGSERDAT